MDLDFLNFLSGTGVDRTLLGVMIHHRGLDKGFCNSPDSMLVWTATPCTPLTSACGTLAGLLESGSFDEEQHGFLSGLLLPGGSVDAASLDFMQHSAELSAQPVADEEEPAAEAAAAAAAPANSAAQWVAAAPVQCDIARAAQAANNGHALQFAGGPLAISRADDDDTISTETVPMPHKRQRRQQRPQQAADEDEDASSSANDLVEMPCSSGDGPPSFKPRTPRRSQDASTSGTAAAAAPATGPRSPDPITATATSAPSASTSASPAAATPAAAPSAAAPSSSDGAVRAVLVAKVLTKSDATSKRIILPRIAVEANLPQLATADHFHFKAMDATGREWELVVKAWANGSNPRPVFVIEQVCCGFEAGVFYIDHRARCASAPASMCCISRFDISSAAAYQLPSVQNPHSRCKS